MVSCGLVATDDDLNIVGKFRGECRPWNVKSFDHETVRIHGLSLDHLMRQQSPEELCIEMLYFLDQFRNKDRIEYVPFIYHAKNRFDFWFMHNLFLKTDLIWSFRKMFHESCAYSTIKMASNMGHQGNGLKDWSQRIGFRLDHHNEMSDALGCLEVLRHLVKQGAKIEDGLETKKEEE